MSSWYPKITLPIEYTRSSDCVEVPQEAIEDMYVAFWNNKFNPPKPIAEIIINRIIIGTYVIKRGS